MYNINEIKLQNQQDCWSMLYMHLGRSILDCCGRGGEGVIREAVRRMSQCRGRALHQQHVEAGIKTNLLNLYHAGYDCQPDPRMHQTVIHETEQVRLWEVQICPMADLWNKAGESRLGSFFCEENQYALIGGYTNGKGQTNVSTMLTCKRDNHCRFSVYYRPANTTDMQREQSFSAPGEEPSGPVVLPGPDFKQGVNALCIKYFYYLLEVADEVYGSEGICAVSLGLRKLTPALVSELKRHADDTLNPCDRAFLDQNFPLALNALDDPLWGEFDGHNAPKLMQVNLLDPLKKQLDLD